MVLKWITLHIFFWMDFVYYKKEMWEREFLGWKESGGVTVLIDCPIIIKLP